MLARADGETKTLRHRLGGPAVPHASGISVQLECRLPAVKDAETRVERFFRLGPEQLKDTGFVPVNSTTTGNASSGIVIGNSPILKRSSPSPKEVTCWWEYSCTRGPNGELQDCTKLEFGGCTGQSSGGGSRGNYNLGDLPSQPCSSDPCPMIHPDDVDGGPTGGPEKRIPQVKDFNLAVDTVKIDELPDCTQDINDLDDPDIDVRAWRDYCESSLPNGTQTQRIKDALNRIEERGKVCAQIAQRARSYLRKDLIYLDPDPSRAGGWGYKGLVIIWDDYVDRYYDDRTKEDDGWQDDGNLDSILSHEFGHVLNEGHIGNTGVTPHEEQCSGLSLD